jgi:hypothetical protein
MLGDFDRHVAENNITDEDLPAAFAQWLANLSGETITWGPADEPPEFVAAPDAEK